MYRRFFLFILLSIMLTSTLALSGCAPSAKEGGTVDGLKMAPLAGMPEAVQKSSETVQQAYQFAVANPEVLGAVPCYCGCGGIGHTSNYSCYVQSGAGSEIVFDNHALGCSICVDIAIDAMRMTKEGKPIAEIRAAIDSTYGQYGESNIP